MTGQQTLIARGALGLLAAASSLAAVSSSRLRQLEPRSFDRFVTAVFPVSRLVLFSLVFLVLRLSPRGDIPAYYWEEALSVLRGLLPYRDFLSSYAPLHPYLDAAAISLWRSPLAIILLAIVAECALLPLWLRFGRLLVSERELRTGCLLYLTSAVSLQFVAVDGQDNVVIALLITLALFLLTRHRPMASGLSAGASVAAIKFLPLVYAPALFAASSRRWRWALGFAAPIVAVYGAFVLLRLPILTPLRQEGHLKCAGNLPFLIESISGFTFPSRLWDLLLLGALATIFVLVARVSCEASLATRLRAMVFGISSLTLSLVLLSKKSWPAYLMLALFPICLLIDERRRLQTAAFAIFGFVAVVEHSFWASLVHQLTARELHRGLLAGKASYVVFLALQLLLLAGYGWILRLSIRAIGSLPPQGLERQAMPSAPDSQLAVLP